MGYAMRRSRAWTILLAAPVALGILGCGKGPEVVSVTGTVTRGGAPLKDFTVVFMPEKGRPSMGRTDEDGHYELVFTRDTEGALLGKHKVFVQYSPSDPQEMMAVEAGKLPREVQAIHAKYGNEKVTPIVVEITGSKVVDLKLD